MRIVLIYAIIITRPPPLVKHIFSIGYIFSFWGMMDGMRNCRGAPWSPMAFAFAKAMPPAAAPHISHPLVPKSQWMTASPPRGGEAFVLCPTRCHYMKQCEVFNQKASPLREKLSKLDTQRIEL